MLGHEPIGKIPAACYSVLPGGHNIKGRSLGDLDIELTRKAINDFKGKVDAVAISGYLSVRNPEHEIAVSKMVKEILNLPVVCAHQLTTSLGFHERTVTAILNARLIPIITELIESVHLVLEEKKIDASIMIVKGDGCLMSESLAREKPIETILSGPASSIIGGTFLTQTPDALVLDMGGTTTDIAILKNGVPRINQEGASVGGWLTRVQAAEVYTYGIGGDSYIQVDRERKIIVGPQRVWPLCLIADRYPSLIEDLKINFFDSYDLMYGQPTDCYMFLKNNTVEKLTEWEEKVILLLQESPRSLYFLAKQLDIDANLFNLQHLVNLGIIARISVTPTDVLHAKGIYHQWNTKASQIGIDILAGKAGMSREEFLEAATERIINDLCITCLQSLAGTEGQKTWFKDDEMSMYFINKALSPQKDQAYDCSFKLRTPVIGIGAPVKAWLPKMAEKLNTQLIIPPHAEIANAVGAATGKIMETIKVLINVGEGGKGFLMHAPWERRVFEELSVAVSFALKEAKERAASAAEKAGAIDYELIINHEDVYANASMIENDVYVESRIEVTAVGRPEWEKEEEKEGFFVFKEF